MLISNKEMEIKASVSKIESLTEQRIFLVDPFQDERGGDGWGGGRRTPRQFFPCNSYTRRI